MTSIYSYYSDYNKQATQFRRDQNMDYDSNSFQWPPTDPINQNKQNNPSEAVCSYPAGLRELPQIDQEEMLSWYRTVPLSHDPQDYHAREAMQDFQLNRKGTIQYSHISLINSRAATARDF